MRDNIFTLLSKFILCVLPTQYGKTGVAINKIDMEIKNDDEFGRSIHIVFTMNTLLNNKQFAKRLQDIEREHGKGSVCVLASKYEGEYTHIKQRIQLQGLCMDETTCPRVIVMCGNTTRYADGLEFMRIINRNRSNIVRVFAYFDELHNYICPELRAQIEEIDSFAITKGIMGFTASPEKIWEREGYWSKLHKINLDNISDQNYVGHKEMVFNLVDDFFGNNCTTVDALDDNIIGFISHVLEKHPNILGAGTRTFIPANTRRITHDQVREIIFTREPKSVVITINGCEKTLQYIDLDGDMKTHDLDRDDDEVCNIIAGIIVRNNLLERPIVITGFLCVSMGQTLTHKDIGSFTSAIFGQINLTNDDTYQLFGRITGRMKGWEKYCKTEVYCPTVIRNRCIAMEECARNMIQRMDIVTHDDYIKPMKDLGNIGKDAIQNIRVQKPKKADKADKADKTDKDNKHNNDKDFKEFDTQELAIAFGKSIGINLKTRKDNKVPKDLMQKDGSNPSCEDLLKRMWGINQTNNGRMICTNTNKWCVYWRPSLLKKKEVPVANDQPKKRGRPANPPKLDKDGNVKTKRVPTAYNRFISIRIKALMQEHAGKNANELMTMASQEWGAMTKEEKAEYNEVIEV